MATLLSFLALAILVVLASHLVLKTDPGTEALATPLLKFAPCDILVQEQMWVCANGRAYVHDVNGWHDAGPMHDPGINVPAVPER